MARELPIACTLSGADLARRLAEIAAVGRDGLIEAETAATGAVLRFHRDRGVADRLDRIVAAESECCAFLNMNVAERGDSLELTIRGPAGAEPVVAELVDAFAGRTETAT